MSKSRPIFLTGVDRSRIGVLAQMLGSHPNIAMTRRTCFWTRYAWPGHALNSRRQFDRCLREMLSIRRMKVFNPDVESLYRAFAAGERTYARLFQLLQEQRLRRLGKSRWGDQSPDWAKHAAAVFRAFPGATMVHVVRDPRDVSAQAIGHRSVRRDTAVSISTADWLSSLRLAKRNVRAYPGRYKIVRYECFAAEPDRTLREICQFVGESYSTSMMEPIVSESDCDASASGECERTEPINDWYESTGCFRDVLSTREIAFIQMLAGHRMKEYGYDAVRTDDAISNRILLYLRDWPINFFRIGLSRARCLHAAGVAGLSRCSTHIFRMAIRNALSPQQ